MATSALEIRNLGPITSADLTIGDLTFLTGPQASGKGQEHRAPDPESVLLPVHILPIYAPDDQAEEFLVSYRVGMRYRPWRTR